MTGMHAYGIVAEARRRGWSLKAIAEYVGCSEDAPRRWPRVGKVSQAFARRLESLRNEAPEKGER